VHIALSFELQSSRIVCVFFSLLHCRICCSSTSCNYCSARKSSDGSELMGFVGDTCGVFCFFPGLSMVSRRQCCCGWWMRWSEMHSSCWSPWKV
jgi:hypothetical protein